ncbi:MAG: xanthine dehydrogenase family protein subunit M [Deltaproteobacteria bacterium]|nr:xanthine dehydrogenase family protein subunit M [Deltaproteobacteria bacterium]
MRIRPFEYHAAVNLEDALSELDEYGPGVKVLAGGTDLILAMKHKTILPSRVVSLHKVGEMDFVRKENSTVRIGALATHFALSRNALLNESMSMLCEAVSLIGSWQIRSIATIGGNLCNASPAADSAAPLLALDARVVIADRDGEKEMPLSSFFTGPGTTALAPNQLLKEIVIERPNAPSAGCYIKLMRKKAVDLSLVGVAFQAETDRAGEKLTRVAIGLGGVAPTPIRAPEAEAMLTGLKRNEVLKALPDAARAAVSVTRPISDIRASAEYRQAMVDVYVRRAGERVVNALLKTGGN